MKGHIFDIKRYAIHDGPGIRVTVFFKGCSLDCWWCHNPEGLAAAGGREISVRELIRDVEKDLIFMEESGGGVTVSGGEPLYQPEFLDSILTECQERGIHTTLDTCGYAPREVFDPILEKVDLFYFDLKFIDNRLHKGYTGVSNASILRNLRVLDEKKIETFVRFPIIPTITDTDENLREVGEFVASLQNIMAIDLLPYHGTAEGKYERLGIANRLEGLKPPSTDEVVSIRDRLQELGLVISVGGSR